MKKLILLLLLAAFASLAAQAATPPTSGLGLRADNPHKWYRPTHLQLQTGGGLGMVAGGAGYDLDKKKSLELDILVGYVPKYYGGSTLSLASAKAMYSPWRVPISEKIELLPLTAGLYFSYTHGTINDELPGQYSADYYWFSTDTRYGPLLGSRLTFLGPPIKATGQPRKISAYYELGSNDLYIISYVQNTKALSIGDILTLALGVKVDF
ncbi:hypothetical protein Q5H93_12520 [Hymenobacter sp. ASUV-10]|uniref:Outer membrane protein beta-barrel domain-containing protein n=1 Tax=Hymenobacter aranciens TaxID=3063996 RepID=A0ABT9BCY8_9BACT|nr:hypothetical protein [Hymenobacter sp. ASUV-10]MDO7875559.1 hypothetical protein [Hymenobacter sp. ASUV-10]